MMKCDKSLSFLPEHDKSPTQELIMVLTKRTPHPAIVSLVFSIFIQEGIGNSIFVIYIQ